MTDSDQETEANVFAMCLLMPESFVREWIGDHCPAGIDLCEEDVVTRIAKDFRVTHTLAAVRLADLGIIGRIRGHRA